MMPLTGNVYDRVSKCHRHKLQGCGAKQLSRTTSPRNWAWCVFVGSAYRRRGPYDEASGKLDAGDPMSGLMSSDWKRSDGPDCGTGKRRLCEFRKMRRP